MYLLLSSIDRLGKKVYSLPALPLFRAFLLNWVADQNEPLEKHLEEMGEDADISVTLLKFDASKPKAAIIVPQVHPGPFKNIGSSLLAFAYEERIEKEFGCDACVPLGILGHELDLASQAQNYKIIAQTIASAKFKAQDSSGFTSCPSQRRHRHGFLPDFRRYCIPFIFTGSQND